MGLFFPLMPRLLPRLLQHWRFTPSHGRRLFPASALRRFDSIIAEGAPRHRAHLKLAIEVALPTRLILRDISTRSRACALLSQHGWHDAADHCHILIYINLADRQVEIVTDAAAASALIAAQWHGVCDRITQGFSVGEPGSGIDAALNELNALLEQAFPALDHVAHQHRI